MERENIRREVQAGKKFTIDLEAIPGAGYMWELTQNPEEFELLNHKVVSRSTEIGGNSTQRFSLVAHHPGSYSLEFELKRKWEDLPVKTSIFSIQVK